MTQRSIHPAASSSSPAAHAALIDSLGLGRLRGEIRGGRHTRHTSGLAPGRLQCNLVILPAAHARDFEAFCRLNARACPLIAMTDPGDPIFSVLGRGLDLRTDVPRYRVYRYGEPTEEPIHILDLWRDDFVAFALGCSFTFERALMEAGLSLRHFEEDKTVPMYRTDIECVPVGPFSGTVVVSMRPVPAHRVDEVYSISSRYPHAHGAPLHFGDPAAIGIRDLSVPDWGDAVSIRDGEVPVFWACGVTPQNVLAAARLELAITHAPGHMLITDLDEFDPGLAG